MPGASQSSSIEPLTAFVVDDEQIIASTIALILKASGFDARPFYDPLKALAASQIEKPDLLITDVMMPGMSGIDLAIQIKTKIPDCKVLLFSGQARTADLLAKANATGYGFAFLTKPVHPTDLLATIKTLR